jgi:large repetitive protein
LQIGTYTILASDANNCTTFLISTIVPSPSIIIDSIVASKETCLPGNDAVLQIFANGGLGNLYYNIGGNSQIANMFSGLNANNYTVLVFDSLQCADTMQFIVIKNANPNFSNIVQVLPLCSGDSNGVISALGNGVGPIQYSIFPNGITNNIGIFNNLIASNYTISITDSVGCSIDTFLQLLEPIAISFSSINIIQPNCFGDNNGVINVMSNGGTGTLQFNLLPINLSNTSGIFSAMNAGNYTIQISDSNSCAKDSSISMNQPSVIILQLDSFKNLLCANIQDAFIKVSAIGGVSNYQYTLLPGSIQNNTGLFQNLLAGNYTIIVADGNGCSTSILQVISSPVSITLSLPTVVNNKCFGDTLGSISLLATGGVGLFNYQLMPNNISNNNGVFLFLAGGNYSIIVKDGNGCIESTIASIGLGSRILFDSLSIQNVLCQDNKNGFIYASASGGLPPYKYALDSSGFSFNKWYKFLTAGVYHLQIIDDKGCKADTLIPLLPNNIFNIQLIENLPISCITFANGMIQVSAFGTDTFANYSFQILPNNISNSSGLFDNLTAGIYTIIARDGNGCMSSIIAEVLDNGVPIVINITTKDITCFGNNALGEASATALGGVLPYTYIWNNNPNLNSASPINMEAGLYTVVVTDADNCTASNTATINAAPCCAIYMPNVFTPNGDLINDKFIPVTNATISKVVFSVYNRWGQKVFEDNNINKGWNGKKNGITYDTDTYYYILDYYCAYNKKQYRLTGDLILSR